MRRLGVFVVVMAVVLAVSAIALADENKADTKAPAAKAVKADVKPAPKMFSKKQAEGVKATDAVSGNEFSIAKASPVSKAYRMYYYFENDANKKTFDADPAKYAVKPVKAK